MTRRDILGLVALAGLVLGCEREERRFRELPAATGRTGAERLSGLQPGTKTPDPQVKSPYRQNAYGISEGKRLYEWYNCSGCHAHGGGDIGPPLMDDRWIYGSDPENIFASIVEGRPNGMPSFRGKLPDHQVWQIVAYVQSMGEMAPKAAASGRSDHMYPGDSEQLRDDLGAGEPRPKSEEAEHP